MPPTPDRPPDSGLEKVYGRVIPSGPDSGLEKVYGRVIPNGPDSGLEKVYGRVIPNGPDSGFRIDILAGELIEKKNSHEIGLEWTVFNSNTTKLQHFLMRIQW